MRVITGSAKGRPLKVPKPTTTRPMTAMVKGALFSMLHPFGIEGRRVLDLYAGSGSLGIEALSRGAATADFVEQDHAASAVIAANLALTRLGERARVHRARVQGFLARLATQPPAAPFDLIIMDPPYAAPDIEEVLAAVATSPVLAPNAVVVVGHAARVALPDVVGPLIRRHRRCHGDSCFSIYTLERPGEPTASPAEGATP